MKMDAKLILMFMLSALAYHTEGEVCRDKSEWCPQMTTHGACGFYKPTQEKCPRRCGLCTARCKEVLSQDRRDCGHYGISYDRCERRGCCFKSHNNGTSVPWCYHAADHCQFVAGDKRRDCGYVGITRDQCLDTGCCWAPSYNSSSNHPWCHHSE